MREKSALKVGDRVGYDTVPSLMEFRGIIVAIGPMARGCDCRVQWERPNRITCDELLRNLRLLEPAISTSL